MTYIVDHMTAGVALVLVLAIVVAWVTNNFNDGWPGRIAGWFLNVLAVVLGTAMVLAVLYRLGVDATVAIGVVVLMGAGFFVRWRLSNNEGGGDQ